MDLLIGLDQYWKFVKPELVPITDGLVAQKTLFGWMVSGLYDLEQTEPVEPKTSLQLLCVEDVRDIDLRKLWDLDLEADEESESSVLRNFMENIEKKDERYEVTLPWKGKFRNFRTTIP